MQFVFYFLAVLICFMSNGFADDYLYLRNTPNCNIKKLINGKLSPTLKNHLLNTPLEAKQLERTPKFISFKMKEETYVASTACVFVANEDFPEVKDSIRSEQLSEHFKVYEHVLKTETEVTQNQYSLNLNKYFIEISGGLTNISDQNQIPVDYNILLPSNSTNPVLWSEADKSPYKTKTLVNLGFGLKAFDSGFLAFKLRAFQGTKVDTLSSTNLNTNITVIGNWYYSEAFTSYYLGYKHLYETDSPWKPTLAGYLGANIGNTTLSDGTDSYNFTSLGIVALGEAGLEYLVNSNISLDINLGFEYIGTRTLKPTENNGATATTQTKTNYSNLSGSLGIKSYF